MTRGDVISLLFILLVCVLFGLPWWWCLLLLVLSLAWLRFWKKGGRS